MSNPMYILPFDKVGRGNLDQVGGKGANLGEPLGQLYKIQAYGRAKQKRPNETGNTKNV